jgi:uncharacterized protein
MQYRAVLTVLLGFASLCFFSVAAWCDTAAGMGAFRNKDYSRAYKEWKTAAEAGQAEAQFDLGVLYAQGLGVPRDLSEAARWYSRAAEQGNAEAQFALGQMCSRGWGVPRDEADAMRWFQLANGNESDGSPTGWEAIQGYGTPQDPQKAAYWYRQAAEKGHAEAQFNLGRLYATGSGVPHDEEQATRWVRASASQGFAPAQARLGMRYAEGNGVTQDDRRAFFWLTLAYLHGEKRVEKLRGTVAAKLNPADVSAAEQAAQNWKPRQPAAPKN